jgi:hypothetical protein
VEYAVSRPGAARGGQAITSATGGENLFPFPSFPFPSPFRVLRVGVLHSSPPSPVVERAAGNSPGFMWLFLPIEG